jgi:hypothetical protein
MKKETFTKLRMLKAIINPFTKCVRFFERDAISIPFVLTVLAHLQAFLSTTLRSWITETDPTYEHCINLFLTALDERRTKHRDEDLLRAAYRLTSFGQVRFKDYGEDSADPELLDLCDTGAARLHIGRPFPMVLEYQAEAESEGEAEIPDIGESPDATADGEEEESCEMLTEAVIVVERMDADRARLIDDRSNEGILSFLITYLTQSMGNDIDAPREYIDAAMVRELIDLFSCSPNGDEMVEDEPPRATAQMTMWKHFDMNTLDRPYQHIVDVILKIIMIPASEASAERALSLLGYRTSL